jgi:hypothetical protein
MRLTITYPNRAAESETAKTLLLRPALRSTDPHLPKHANNKANRKIKTEGDGKLVAFGKEMNQRSA